MAQKVREIMTRDLVQLPASSSVTEAATRMREADVGDVIVQEDGKLCGILTDRDIVVRVLGAGRDPNKTQLKEACSQKLIVALADDDVERLIQIMRSKAIRRVPVVDDKGQPIGIVSLGDLAQNRDPKSVLGAISSAAPTH
jgi:CBS domain-containing protein